MKNLLKTLFVSFYAALAISLTMPSCSTADEDFTDVVESSELDQSDFNTGDEEKDVYKPGD